MSPISSKTEREIAIEEYRKQDQLFIINLIKEKLSVEENTERKENIEACLQLAQSVRVTGSDRVVGIGGKATILSQDEFRRRFDDLDVESRRLVFAVVRNSVLLQVKHCCCL